MGHGGHSRGAVAVAGIVAALAVSAGGVSAANPTAPPAGEERAKRCVKTIVGDRVACIGLGDRCRPRFAEDYLVAGLTCRKKKLRNPSFAEVRGDDPVLADKTGRITLQTGLEAFDRLIAPLPGLNSRPGTVGETPVDAGFAFEAIMSELDALPPEQRAVVDQAVTTNPDAGANRAPPTAEEQQRVLGWIDDARRRYEAHGYSFSRRIHLNFLDGFGEGPEGAWAYTVPMWLWPDPAKRTPNCEIWITGKGRAEDQTFMRAAMAHEVAHCLQHEFYATFQDVVNVPGWVKEGGAQWLGWSAANELGIDPPAEFAWNDWLRRPNAVDLFRRTYPAVGFWAMLQQGGVNVWERYKAVMRAAVSGGSQGAYQAAIGGTARPSAFERWGPGFVRKPTLGRVWDLTGPGIVPSDPPFTFVVGRGDIEAIAAQPRSGVAAEIRNPADVIVVRVAPGTQGLIADGAGRRLRLATGAYTTLANLRCRTGRQVNLPYLAPGSIHAGFGGSNELKYAIFQGMSRDDYCAGRRPPRPPRPGATCTAPAGDPTARSDAATCGYTIPGISIYAGEEDPQVVATFKSGNCTFGDDFVATASDNGWELEVGIDAFAGFDQDYRLIFGAPDPQVVINGPGGPYGNQTSKPSSEGPAPSGTILLHPTGDLGLGMVALNEPAESGVIAAGVMDCVYPFDE